MKIDIEADIALAKMGKENWEELCKEHAVDKYILLPHVGDEYNKWAAYYFTEYMKQEKAETAVIISSDSNDLELFVHVDAVAVTKALKSDEWISSIIKFYALYEFTSNLVIVSLTRPYNTCGENLIGVKGVTKRGLLCYDIYGFSSIPKE